MRLWQYPHKSEPVFTPAPEVVTLDKWYAPLVPPTRRTAGALVAAALVASGLSFVEPFVREGTGTGPSSDSSATVFFKRTTQYPAYSAPVFTPVPEVVTLDKWYAPLEEPVRLKPAIRTALVPAFDIDSDALTRPEASTPDRWHQPLSEPVRVRPPLPIGARPYFWLDEQAATQPETTTPDRWFQPLSEPRRSRPPLPTAAQHFFTVDAFALTQPEQTTVDRWYSPLSLPRWERKPLPIGARPHSWDDPFLLTQAEQTSVDRWYLALSIPVRRAPPVPRPYFFAPETTPAAAPDATFDSWFQPLSEPRWSKKPLPVGALPSSWDDPHLLTQAEATTVDRWYQPFGQRRAVPRFIHAAFFAPESSAETVTLDKWFAALSEPTRRRTRPTGPSFDIDPRLLTQAEATTVDRWFQALSEPIWTRKPLPGAARPSFFIDPHALTQPEATTLDRWYQPFSEPIRERPPLSVAAFPAIFWHPETPLSDFDWFYLTAQPLFKKRPVPYQIAVIDDVSIYPPNASDLFIRWFGPLNEPPKGHRIHGSLLAGLVDDVNVWPAPVLVPAYSWFTPLSEPVRPIVLPVAAMPAMFRDDVLIIAVAGTGKVFIVPDAGQGWEVPDAGQGFVVPDSGQGFSV